MKLEDLTTIDQLEDFLSGTQAVAFSVISDNQLFDMCLTSSLSHPGRSGRTIAPEVRQVTVPCPAARYARRVHGLLQPA